LHLFYSLGLNPTLLEKNLLLMVKHPTCKNHLEFDNKRLYFRSQLKRLRKQASQRHGSLRLAVHRNQIFQDSFNKLRHKSPEEMRGKLNIAFSNEEGIDAGGVTREWFSVMAREMFNPNYALFKPTHDGATFQPNPISAVNQDHLDYFKFVGRVIGKAIADGQLMDVFFTRSFYKHILGIPVNNQDMQSIDPEYYKNFTQILNYDLETLGLEMNFETDVEYFGRKDTYELKPGGKNIAVTEDNKREYVSLMCKYKMTSAIKDQIRNFLLGFHDLVPAQLISIFNENELELLISGMPEIDLKDLRNNTEYVQFKAGDEQITWFWNVLNSFTAEEKAMFLQFVTGTSKVPLEGFKGLQGMRGVQKFNIHKAHTGEHSLPCSHTCFNQLDLPVYTSEEQTKEKLMLAFREGHEGFSFG